MPEWRAIPGYPNYEASDEGQIRNRKTGRILKQQKTERYAYLSLGRDNTVAAHRAVALAFHPQTADQVNHKNGDRYDNRAANLEWCSCSENNLHGRRVLGRCVHEKHGQARLNWDKVIEIRIRAGEGCKPLGREFGVSGTAIKQIVSGRTWQFNWARHD